MSEKFSDMHTTLAQKILGDRLRQHRIARGLQQAELADKAKVSREAISKVENGRPVNLDTFLQVLKSLDLLDRLDAAIDDAGDRPTEKFKNEGKRRYRVRRGAKTGSEVQPGDFIWPEDRK